MCPTRKGFMGTHVQDVCHVGNTLSVGELQHPLRALFNCSQCLSVNRCSSVSVLVKLWHSRCFVHFFMNFPDRQLDVELDAVEDVLEVGLLVHVELHSKHMKWVRMRTLSLHYESIIKSHFWKHAHQILPSFTICDIRHKSYFWVSTVGSATGLTIMPGALSDANPKEFVSLPTVESGSVRWMCKPLVY